MGRTLGFGIVGCGYISKLHAQAIKSIDGARLAAISSSNREKASAFAAQFGCDYYLDYNEMLKRDDIDVISICTPNGTHRDLGVAAAKAGKHVIVEKPIDVSLEAADELIKACREAGVKLSCISQHRYDEGTRKLKQAVREGKLGQLNFGASHTKWYRTQDYYDSGKWRGTLELDGGGALINQSIHYVDLLQYIMGPVDEVSAYCTTRAHERIEVEDIAVAAVKFRNGAVGLIEGNTAAYPGFCTRLDIYGSKGSVIIENDRVKEWKVDGDSSETGMCNAGANELKGASSPEITCEAHTKQIREFVQAVESNTEPPVTGEEGRSALALVLAVYESSRTGKPVKVKQAME